MSLSDLSKQLDARKQTSTKEQPYAMGRQTVRKARTDLTSKDFEASIKLKTMPAVKWLEVQFPKVFIEEINEYIDDDTQNHYFMKRKFILFQIIFMDIMLK